MTGEVTLHGEVLPIGGLKEKALAAQRLGIRTIIAPELNAQDVEEIPEQLREQLDFHFTGRVEEVLDIALEPSRVGSASNGQRPEGRAEWQQSPRRPRHQREQRSPAPRRTSSG
jgi:predicted ATP-dependent protease